MSNFPYCEKCLEQPTTDTKEFYDYRFDYPVCISCVEKYDLEVACDRPECRSCYPDPKPYNEEDHECENHTWTLQMNIANTPTQNYCEECGATEPADPEDVAEQIRLLGENE
jgi:hypothetical protein